MFMTALFAGTIASTEPPPDCMEAAILGKSIAIERDRGTAPNDLFAKIPIQYHSTIRKAVAYIYASPLNPDRIALVIYNDCNGRQE